MGAADDPRLALPRADRRPRRRHRRADRVPRHRRVPRVHRRLASRSTTAPNSAPDLHRLGTPRIAAFLCDTEGRAARDRRPASYCHEHRPSPRRRRTASMRASSRPSRRSSLLQPGAVALGRLDVVDGLDGVEDGLWALGSLAARGVVVLNRAGALLAAHDKLLTAKVLQRAGLPHPRTRILHPGGHGAGLGGPARRQAALRELGPRRRALRGRDRVPPPPPLARAPALVPAARSGAAGARAAVRASTFASSSPEGTAVGAISRVAAPGEWRTNIALGGTRVRGRAACGGARARRPGRRRGRRRPDRRRPAARRRRRPHASSS